MWLLHAIGLSFLVTDSNCHVIGLSLHVSDLTFHETALAFYAIALNSFHEIGLTMQRTSLKRVGKGVFRES